MKLKESTFAIIAEKKDSISHKWFRENLNLTELRPTWDIGFAYYFDKGLYKARYRLSDINPKGIPIYTESEFERLLESEELNSFTESPLSGKPKELTEIPTWSKTVGFTPLSNMKDPVKATESNQVIFSYQTAIDLLAYYTKIDKEIIKIEMP